MQFLIVQCEARDGAVDLGTALQTGRSRGIGIFHWHNSSGRTMPLESTQSLAEMSISNISWTVNAADVFDLQPYHLQVPIV
jgi:hypothetical protein